MYSIVNIFQNLISLIKRCIIGITIELFKNDIKKEFTGEKNEDIDII